MPVYADYLQNWLDSDYGVLFFPNFGTILA